MTEGFRPNMMTTGIGSLPQNRIFELLREIRDRLSQ